MKAILSFHHGPTEPDVILHADGLGNALAAIRDLGDVEVLVFHSKAAGAFAKDFPEARWIEIPSMEEPDGFVDACAAAVAEATRRGLIAGETQLFFLDCRNPLLDIGDLRQALRLSAPTGCPVLAMSPVQDHPCQYRTHYSVVAVALLPLPDPEFTVDALAGQEHIASQPFPLSWVQLFVEVPVQSRCYRVPRDRPNLVPLDFHGFPQPGECILYHVSPESARSVQLLAPGTTGMSELAIPPFFAANEWPFIGRLQQGKVTLHLSLDVQAEAGDEVQVIRFEAQSPQQSVAILKPGWRNEADSFASPDGQRLSGPLLTLDATGDPLVCILRRESCSESDVSDIFRHEGFPWGVDSSTGLPTSNEDGRIITGRQDFPPIFQVKGSLAFGRASDLIQLRSLIASGGVAGLDLGNRAVHPRNEMDLLRLAVMRKPWEERAADDESAI
jgi:hypothetical protein